MTATDTWGTTPGPWKVDPSDCDGDGFIERDTRAIAAIPDFIALVEGIIRDADAGHTVGQALEAEARAIKRRVTGG